MFSTSSSQFFVGIFLISRLFAFAQEVVVESVSGSAYAFFVEGHESFSEVLALATQTLAVEEGVDCHVNHQPIFLYLPLEAKTTIVSVSNKKASSTPRDYSVIPTSADKKDIFYIVTTLANKSLVKIYSMKSSLEKAGDRVNPIHPLRFLQCIFSEEELKAGIMNIRNRSMVWKDFFSGLRDSLEEEANRGNMQLAFIQHFSSKLGIDPNAIVGLIEQRRWNDLVDTLMVLIPREGDPSRYDM